MDVLAGAVAGGLAAAFIGRVTRPVEGKAFSHI
jgi:hypothetical protein